MEYTRGIVYTCFCIHVCMGGGSPALGVTQSYRLHSRALKSSPWLLAAPDVVIMSLVLTALSEPANKFS